MAASSFRYDIYTVGWVCALPIELAAAEKLLDEKHCDPPHDDHDSNLYTLGRINQHNVVIAALPAGYKGNNPAAAVAVRMKARFTSIRFSLLVGVGAGVPSSNNDIRLGDVVISQPHAGHGGVVQYDFGKATPGVFKRTGFLNSPPTVLLQALTRLQARQMTGSVDISAHLSRFGDLPIFARHQAGPDLLFQSSYQHVGGSTCEKCDESYLVKRPAREAEIVIHSGTIASGNQVIRESDTRDRISSELDGALCFEMEAAGLMHSFPCLVIRGICDYADTHKNKGWQAYAAATAAACAKEILSHIPSADVARSSTARTIAQASVDQDVKASTEPMPPCYNTAPSDRSSRLIGYDDCLNDIEAGLRSGIWSEVIITGERGSG
jgi:nucleoside phosphorylase